MESRSENKTLNQRYGFLLFISGMSEKSVQAIANLQHICDTYLHGDFDLEIVDISTNTELAITHQVIAIPTLVKLSPGAKRTILGDLSETEKVLKILQISE